MDSLRNLLSSSIYKPHLLSETHIGEDSQVAYSSIEVIHKEESGVISKLNPVVIKSPIQKMNYSV
jgi:hypothetical protein